MGRLVRDLDRPVTFSSLVLAWPLQSPRGMPSSGIGQCYPLFLQNLYKNWSLPVSDQSSERRGGFFAAGLMLLVLLSAGIRVFFWQIYQPQTAGDTGTYLRLASEIGSLDFSGYQGRRTPMYPLLLVVAQMNYTTVWLIQSLLGVGISVLLYLLVLQLVPSVGLALALALLHSLTLNQLFYEANILTETLATFLLVASVLLMLKANRVPRGVGWAALVGLCMAATVLTRPNFIYLGPLYGLVLLVAAWGRDKRRLLAFVAAFALPIFGWMLFNKATIGYFGLTTQIGMSLAQHSGKFMDKAPDEFATLREIYMKRRAQMPPDADRMNIWDAVPDMLEKTRLSFVELNRELTKLSVQLIASHPGLYLRSVGGAWVSFWAVPNTWNLEDIHGPGTRRALESIWSVEQFLLRAMNLALVLLAPCLAVRALFRRFADRRENSYLLLAAVVVAGSIVQALLEATDNGRYSIPTQPLVVVFVVALGYQYLRERFGTRRPAIPAQRDLATVGQTESNKYNLDHSAGRMK